MNCVFGCSNNSSKVTELALAKNAFQSLSPEEQDRVVRDIYGHEVPVEETPEFVHDKLQELDDELKLLSAESQKYYNLAVQMEQDKLRQQLQSSDLVDIEDEFLYVGSKKFRLMFLRAERFNARLAAKRLSFYFKEKYNLFGKENLSRKFKQDDLNEEEKLALVSGTVVYVGTSDLAGRPLIFFRDIESLPFDVTTLQRTYFYLFSKIIEDNEIGQKKGYVGVAYHFDAPLYTYLAIIREKFPSHRLLSYGLPLRIAGAHDYYNDQKENFFLNLLLVLMPKEDRARCVGHYFETVEECVLSMMAYGINADTLPINLNFGQDGDDDAFLYDVIREYWDKQNQIERRETTCL